MSRSPSPTPQRPSLSGIVVACVIAALLALVQGARAQSGAARPVPSAVPGNVAHGDPHADTVPQSARPPGSRPGDGGPSPVIFPPQSITIRFNHKKHVRELGMTCTTCHDAALKSHKSSDSLVPAGTRCDSCHGSDHRSPEVTAGAEAIGKCAFCHVGYREGSPVQRLVIPPPNLRFDHAKHLDRGMSCESCHGRVEEVELATVDQLPRMRACLSCHQDSHAGKGRASGACQTCHLVDKPGLLKTEFASGTLLPPAWLHDSEHGPDWIERHKRVAGDDSRFCSNCHTERFCTACHDGRVRPRRVHPNDWISQHPIAARQDSPTCTSCHRQQSFCLSCHQQAGITLSGPYANFAQRGRFHPPKSVWTDGPPRTRSHHSWEAERNLNACVSCHTERDCATCHATAAVGGRGSRVQVANPHPADFLSRCRGALRSNARPCLVCHEPADPNLSRCR